MNLRRHKMVEDSQGFTRVVEGEDQVVIVAGEAQVAFNNTCAQHHPVLVTRIVAHAIGIADAIIAIATTPVVQIIALAAN